MKCKLLLALLPAVCLCWQASLIHAQQASSPGVTSGSIATGAIAGVLKDPSGAVVPGARIEVRNLASGARRSLVTDLRGRFVCQGLAAGRYQVSVAAADFDTAILHDLSVRAGSETAANIALRIAPARTDVEVTGTDPGAGAPYKVDLGDQAQSRNSAELLRNTPGVSLRENTQLASVPLLHGLGDERAKLVVDGMTVSSACANHMNPPLSYIAPSQTAQVTVMAGITPVSLGGDSLGGTIAIASREPVFAKPGERLHSEADSSGFYASNGQNYGGAFSAWAAGRNLGVGYSGSWANGDDYTDGSGHKITSTYAQSTDHTVTLAAQGAGNLLVLQAGLHHVPYEGFVNAQMDMVRNYAESLNLRYRRSLGSGLLDTRIYWQGAWHAMNIGRDKSAFPMPMWMPMDTHGRDSGYSVKYELPLSARHTLNAGSELHHFVLDDRWPAVAGTAPMMGPNTFVSINNGRRTRLGWFAEVASKWNPQWTTLLGLRNDTVWSNAGPVQGYSSMMYGAGASAFNALNRAHADVDLDATALARYQPNPSASFEFGYARKSRAPNLYERYAWSTNWMASGMIGWFGDGNYYVGNPGLKPEIAHTVSATATLRGRAPWAWEIALAPYLTYIRSYVDVDTLATTTYGLSNFAQLRFANHNARIDGADFSANGTLWNRSRFGQGKVSGAAAWLHGERLDAKTGLYQMMPLNARVVFDEELKGFAAGIGLQAVDRKADVDPRRLEQKTPGYALLTLHSAYRRGFLRASVAGDNVLNKCYELPLGGVNFDDFMASGWMSQIKPITGRGRSFQASLTARF
jgi:iron complex outermembrane receptor protein